MLDITSDGTNMYHNPQDPNQPWQLVGENVLQGDQPEHGLPRDLLRQAVGHTVELDKALPLLDLGRLIPDTNAQLLKMDQEPKLT